MTVNEVKHQVKLAEWKERILECRSQGLPVVKWCAQNGYHRTTYYKWEREIFGQLERARKTCRSQQSECVIPAVLPHQPEFAELPIVAPTLALPESVQTPMFEPVAIIRIGKVELELSNSVSGDLMRHLKGLMSLAE